MSPKRKSRRTHPERRWSPTPSEARLGTLTERTNKPAKKSTKKKRTRKRASQLAENFRDEKLQAPANGHMEDDGDANDAIGDTGIVSYYGDHAKRRVPYSYANMPLPAEPGGQLSCGKPPKSNVHAHHHTYNTHSTNITEHEHEIPKTKVQRALLNIRGSNIFQFTPLFSLNPDFSVGRTPLPIPPHYPSAILLFHRNKQNL